MSCFRDKLIFYIPPFYINEYAKGHKKMQTYLQARQTRLLMLMFFVSKMQNRKTMLFLVYTKTKSNNNNCFCFNTNITLILLKHEAAVFVFCVETCSCVVEVKYESYCTKSKIINNKPSGMSADSAWVELLFQGAVNILVLMTQHISTLS